MHESHYSEPVPPGHRAQRCCPIVELRQYTLHPGTRDVLIDLFDREFVESQEAAGMRVIGQFRDLDDPDRFVWLRGFPDMPTRARALEAFYSGPVWNEHSEVANATMVDFSNVLLLRPARSTSGFSLADGGRSQPGSKEPPEGLVLACVYYLDGPVEEEFLDFYEAVLKPAVTAAGASVLGYFVTESSPNNFPALPVREDENVFVSFSCFSEQAAYEDSVAALAPSQRLRSELSEALARRCKVPPEVRKLLPTARSHLHG